MKYYKQYLLLCLVFVACCSCRSFKSKSYPLAKKEQYLKRSCFGAKFEPKETVLHGAGQDFNGFSDYRKALGPTRTPKIYMTYIGIANPPQVIYDWGWQLKNELDQLKIDGLIPQIGLTMIGGDPSTGALGDAGFAAGDRDENIEAFCKAVKALDTPVFIRIGYEFETSGNNYKPETYIPAFIRIYKALQKHGIDFASIWCITATYGPRVPWDRLMQYYPGDEYVDWWGVDIFSIEHIFSDRVLMFCDEAAQHNKPVMIGESTPRYVGTLQGKTSWDGWFIPYFKLIRRTPNIKAFCYINWEWGYWSDKLGFGWHAWGDCRIEKNDYVTQMYKKEMNLPLYQHSP